MKRSSDLRHGKRGQRETQALEWGPQQMNLGMLDYGKRGFITITRTRVTRSMESGQTILNLSTTQCRKMGTGPSVSVRNEVSGLQRR